MNMSLFHMFMMFMKHVQAPRRQKKLYLPVTAGWGRSTRGISKKFAGEGLALAANGDGQGGSAAGAGSEVRVNGGEGIENELIAECAAEGDSGGSAELLLEAYQRDIDECAASVGDGGELNHSHKAVDCGDSPGLKASGDKSNTTATH